MEERVVLCQGTAGCKRKCYLVYKKVILFSMSGIADYYNHAIEIAELNSGQ